MTEPPELLDEGPDDVEEIIVSWLAGLRDTAKTRRAGDPLPFTLVTHIAGSEDECLSTADPVVSVHTLCDKAGGESAAAIEANKTHRRMLLLARYLEDVELSDGRFATIDYVSVFESPRWIDYGDDQILRKVGRYTIGIVVHPRLNGCGGRALNIGVFSE